MSRRLAMAMVLGVLAASGTYVLVYLFRWEWHRAIITGIFFLAAETALAVMVVLHRLDSIEARMDALARGDRHAAPTDPVLDRLRSTAPEPSKPFEWLDPTSRTTNVFLPFLLGVGAITSALAWVVEHLARRSAVPVLERRLASALAPLALPAGGLVGYGPVPVPARSPTGRGRTLALLAVGVVATVGATGLIDVVADAIQTRPDATEAGVRTTVEVQLRGATAHQHTERSATHLWGTCSHVLHSRGVGTTIEVLETRRVAFVIPSDVGPHGRQRLRGCLEDAVVDRVQATIVEISRTE